MVIQNDKDFVARTTYSHLTENLKRTVSDFVIYSSDRQYITVPDIDNQRENFINNLIKYFEGTEEFEKCKTLLDIKGILIKTNNSEQT